MPYHVQTMTKKDPKVIAAVCFLNEAENIKEMLQSLYLIKDLHAIHMLDGLWQGGHGSTGHLNSTDGTKDIVIEMQRKHFDGAGNQYNGTITVQETTSLFQNESDKRNYQLFQMAKQYGEHTIAMVIDADEYIRFNNGFEEIYLRDHLPKLALDATGIATTFASGSDNPLATTRFIPLGKGYHYHTELPMMVHDGYCRLVHDYMPGHEFIEQQSSWYKFNKFFFVNKWPKRDMVRMQQKSEYCGLIESLNRKTPCRWKTAGVELTT